MGGLKAIEDRPTPKEVYNWRLYAECLVLAFGSLLFGYDGAFVGTTIARDAFKRDFGITSANSSDVSSNITSAFQAGAFFGALFCFFITEKIGRKWALQVNTVVFILGAALMTGTSGNLGMIYAGRVLTGIGCGAITATVPSYIAELSVPSIRGILTGFFEILYQIGSLIGFWINYGINKNVDVSSSVSWRIPMAVQLIPSVLLFIGTFFIHESPLWLMRKGKQERAHKALQTLRKLPVEHLYVREDIMAMEKRLAEEASISDSYGTGTMAFYRGAFAEFCHKGMRNRFALIFCAFALQNFSGAAAINYYSPTLFASLGITDTSLYTGIYGLVKAIASIIYYIFFVDMVGRRRPTIVSSIGCSACLWFVGAYVKIGNPAAIIKAGGNLSTSTAEGGKAAIAMIMIYSVFWSFGLNGIPWIVAAEIFPGALRSFSGTYAALVQWLTQFTITKSLPYIFSSFGYGTWFFFASILLVASIWSFFFLPETKGVTTDQMDYLFGYNCQGYRGIPHTSVSVKLTRESHDTSVAEHDKKMETEHTEAV
ncbi:MFS quinate transporter QutD [Xylariales sp. AK1849]|nr:MFS quinate transporter QutD [Xylariales sp. AK1849]